MLQMSKILRSRNEWRKKAIQRASDVRELKKAKRRYQKRIAQLKAHPAGLEEQADKEKSSLRNAEPNMPLGGDLSPIEQTRALCILLVIQGVVSYRSVPRILELWPGEGRIPHFTSVINRVLRLGLGLLKQVKPAAYRQLAVIDHSIDVGTKKALAVLRVPAGVLSQKKQAIQLQDCECIGLRISETVNGESIAQELDGIFQQAGTPVAVLKDCDRTLNKGVKLWQKKNGLHIPVLEDISHVMAAALKAQFEHTEDYRKFVSLAGKGAKNLRQTALAFLAPPKLRAKGRFLSIGRLGQRGAKMAEALSAEKDADACNNELLEKLRGALPDFDEIKPFIRQFADTADAACRIMETIKNKGINRATYGKCLRLAQTLPDDSKVKQRLSVWLKQHIAAKKQITVFSLPVCSDIIESLFGRFKYMLERNPQADMNRSALLIPALCGNLNETVIKQALDSAKHDELKRWEQNNIPYTMRKKRREFFSGTNPEIGELLM